jgi:hypothetical protein
MRARTSAVEIPPASDSASNESVRDGLVAVRAMVDSLVGQLGERWMSVSAFAAAHHVHPITVRRAARRGELEVRRIGRRLLVRASARTSTPTPIR